MRIQPRKRAHASNMTSFATAVLLVWLGTAIAEAAQTPFEQQAQDIYDATGISGGLIVHLGCGSGQLTAALHRNDSYLVQGLDAAPDNVRSARMLLAEHGIYGPVTVNLLTDGHLPYIDNLVNLVVVDQLGDVSMDEVMRVLCPNGVAYVREGDTWIKRTKPRSEEIDQWTHYLHDASNNAVAHDQVVGPPRRLQWTDGPQYSRHHDRMSSVSAVVSANGRVFSIEDEQSAISILLPSKWMLTARDAFNGTTLWKRPIKKWFTQFWPLKSGPAVLPRRLVASGDRVYLTMGIDGPFVALDAASGETVRRYDRTTGTEEAILVGDTLYLVVNPHLDVAQYAQPQRFNKAYGAKFWDGTPRQLMAIDADSGRQLWSQETVILPGTLAADQQHVLWHDGQCIVCLDRESGKQQWRSKSIPRADEIRSFYLPILVLYKDVVLFSGGETAGLQTGSWYEKGKDTMTALSLDDGQVLWSAPHPPSGYRSPEDLLVVNGLVWTGETTSGRAAGRFTGRDPHTGKIVSQFNPDVSTYWFHHRCYRGKATDNYLLMSRTGTEFIDVRKQHWDINDWVRGACLYGVMPANGLLYAPRHPCACYLEAKLSGFNAVAPAATQPQSRQTLSDGQRLVRGPAYDETIAAESSDVPSSPEDWPTFRHDAGRTGHASTSVPTKLHGLGHAAGRPFDQSGRCAGTTLRSIDRHAYTLRAGRGKR